MLILVVLISLTRPTFTKIIEDSKLKADAGKMSWVLRTARQEAIMTGEEKTVVFYTGNTKYKFEGETTYWLNPGISYAGEGTLSGDIGRKKCIFLPSGAPVLGGTVVLKNSLNSQRYIIVNPVAGRIRVSKLPPANW